MTVRRMLATSYILLRGVGGAVAFVLFHIAPGGLLCQCILWSGR